MDTLLDFLTLIVTSVLLILVLITWSACQELVKSVRSEIEELRAQADLHTHADSSVEETTRPVEETTQFPIVEDDEPKAIPLDPNNEPTWKVYNGVQGKRWCTCHNRPIIPGQRVCLWPREDVSPGAMDLYCESWMKEQEERRP